MFVFLPFTSAFSAGDLAKYFLMSNLYPKCKIYSKHLSQQCRVKRPKDKAFSLIGLDLMNAGLLSSLGLAPQTLHDYENRVLVRALTTSPSNMVKSSLNLNVIVVSGLPSSTSNFTSNLTSLFISAFKSSYLFLINSSVSF